MARTRKLIIGDLHGRHDLLKKVLELCNYDENHDEILALGDLIDGPGLQSREVLEFFSDLQARGRHPTIILGSHEWIIRSIGENHLPAIGEWLSACRGDKTLQSYKVDVSRIRVSGNWVWFAGRPCNGHQALLRIFPPDHLALIENAITTCVIKNTCTGVDLLLSHAGPTVDKSFAETEDWNWVLGDDRWYKTGKAVQYPSNLIHVYGHFHADRPVLQPGRIGLGMAFDLALLSVEERTIYTSNGGIIRIKDEWVCPR